jgi:CheY-like chemotaxis protein
MLVAITLGIRKVGHSRKLALIFTEPAGSPEQTAPAMSEEQEKLSGFVANFRIGPAKVETTAPVSAFDPGREANPEVLAEFFAKATDELAKARALFTKAGNTTNPVDRQALLRDLHVVLESFKAGAGLPGLRPIWQLTAAVEGLVDQLAEKPSNLTPSALRTVAGALVLLESLCVPGIRPDLGDNPPVRLLSIDDDAISRRAVAMALNKSFPKPDTAENGISGLELASQNTYDVIFLDVEMPDLDGFEVCSRIHETALNRTTPVVFVTSHSDFDSRTKSAASGGRDLIAKPFLTFEVTVKALTWLLRGRLEQPNETPAAATTASPAKHVESKSEQREAAPASTSPSHVSPVAPSQPSAAYLDGFAKEACARLSALRESLAALPEQPDETQLHDLFGEMYIGLHAIQSDADRLHLKAFVKLADATGKLLRKVLEKPASVTPSVTHSLQTALERLENLCRTGFEAAVRDTSVHALVVDDDAIARRTMSNALQLSYTQPELAENGSAAVTLAASKRFDVIFMDVLMPELDGFETAAKLRLDGANRDTPIIFVTSLTDTTSRAKAEASGASGFICKPVLPAEIALLSLAFSTASAD